MKKQNSALNKLNKKNDAIGESSPALSTQPLSTKPSSSMAEKPVQEQPQKPSILNKSKKKSPLQKAVHNDGERDRVPVTQNAKAPEQKKESEKVTKAEDVSVNENGLPDINYNEYENVIEAEDILNARKERRAERKRKILLRVVSFILIFGCVYMIFLIYGAVNTEYTYDEKGQVLAQRMTIAQIDALEEFEVIANNYRQARLVYETVLKLDYRVAAGIEDTLLIAPEYEKELENIEALTIQIQAVEISAKYTQAQAMLLAWVQNDIAIYCQRMSAAISQNNETYASQAIEYKSIVYNDFSLITENLLTLGQNVKGTNITDIAKWSPESFIRDNVGGLDGGVMS